MKAVIMAGGEGTRLRPLTCCMPKPMAPVMNRPVMEHIINLLKNHSITDIAATLQFLPTQISDYFGDGSDLGVNLQYFIEDRPLGTAGSVKNAGGFLDDTFVVISGDALTDIDLTKAIEYHKTKGSIATLVLSSVQNPLEYGVVVTEKDGRVQRFVEKPGWSEVFSDTVNTGIYILEPEVMDYVKPGEMFDFSKDLFPLLMNKGMPLYGYIASGYWCDIGDIEAYKTCHYDILDKKAKLSMNAFEINPGVWVENGAVIEQGAQLYPPVYIGKSARIESGAIINPYSVLGSDVTLGANANVSGSIIWKGAIIKNGAQLNHCVICDRVVIKEQAAVFEGAVIGKNTHIEERAVVQADIKVWNDKVVEADTELSNNLIRGSKSGRALFGEKGISGSVNIDITPEYASRISSAFGALVGQNTKVAVSTDSQGSSLMIKEAVLSGMLSCGQQVLDFGQQPIPITRAGIRFYGLSGGIHVAGSNKSGEVQIDILDKSGANISRGQERKLENLFMRDDFVRVSGDYVKEAVSLASYRLYYLRDIVNKTKNQKIGFNVLLNIKSQLVKSLVISLLNDLGCHYKMDTEKANIGTKEGMADFAKAVEQGNYDLGAIIDNSGERLILCDHKGRIISDEIMSCMSALIIFKAKPGAAYIAPLSAPDIIESMASRYNGKVIRTKTSPIEVMSKLSDCSRDVSLCEQFVLEFDAIGGLVKIMDFLKGHGSSLAAFVEEIPSFYIAKEEAPCSFSKKGLVIRRLAEASSGKRVELTEGVKVYERGGWVLVLPDAQKPTCRIISEGYTEEFAQELVGEYMDKIKKINEE